MLIITSGLSCFIAPKYHNQIFAVISGQGSKISKYGSTLQHIGYEDSVVNHLLLIKDIESNEWGDNELDRRTQASMLSRRFFTV